MLQRCNRNVQEPDVIHVYSISISLSCPASVNSRKDKSLRVMSQKFVMLFLVSNPRVVSLDVAAKILIGEDQVADQDKNKFKSEYGHGNSLL